MEGLGRMIVKVRTMTIFVGPAFIKCPTAEAFMKFLALHPFGCLHLQSVRIDGRSEDGDDRPAKMCGC